MQEIISIHVGQAGVQIASTCWELYCIEHGIWPDGFRTDNAEACGGREISFGSFFEETDFGRYVPRAVLVDLEPLVIDEIRMNQYKHLFRPSSLVSGKEDAANNYSRGYYTCGREIIKTLSDVVRREATLCDGLDGFLFFHSMGGGTGSGLSALLMETLYQDYPRKKLLEFVVYPSPRLSTATVEPYNAILSTNATMDKTDCCFLMDNEAMYDICSINLDVEDPTYVHLNRMLAQVISSLTAGMRFDGSINVELTEFQTNLVPFPRIHFPLLTYSPFLSSYRASHERITISTITNLCFQQRNQLLKCDPSRGKYMACVLLYRGIIPPAEINNSLNLVRKSKIPFVNWCPTAFKVGINFQPPSDFPNGIMSSSHLALCSVANTTAISEAWARIDYKFDLMFSKRSFVHWYLGEGMEESEFIQARENLAGLEQDYAECANEEADGGTALITSTSTTRITTPRTISTRTTRTPITRTTRTPITRTTRTPITPGSLSTPRSRSTTSSGPGPRRKSTTTKSPGRKTTTTKSAGRSRTPVTKTPSKPGKKKVTTRKPRAACILQHSTNEYL